MTEVSIVIPVHDGERFLGEAIDSVLGQGIGGTEVIVVDDGSTDGTPAVAAGFGSRIRYLHQARQGPAAARNTGIRAARGGILGFLDADDIWCRGRLAEQLALLRAQPRVSVVTGAIRHLVRLGERWQPAGEPFRAMVLTGSLFRSEVFRTVGLLDPDLAYCEDVDWHFRARRAGVAMVAFPEVTMLYRRHEANMTRHIEQARQHTLLALAKHRAASRGDAAADGRQGSASDG